MLGESMPAFEYSLDAFLLLELDEAVDENDIVDSSCTRIGPLREGASEQLLIAIVLHVEFERSDLDGALDPGLQMLTDELLRRAADVRIGLRLEGSDLRQSRTPDCVRQIGYWSRYGP